MGACARDQGALRPDAQVVVSAKSWLCHPDVDRTARILPWGAGTRPRCPPSRPRRGFSVTCAMRGMKRPARGRPEWRLEHQEVVLAVPASFDQEARELTLEAARDAGLAHVTLLEEPLAAFYAWTASHRRALSQLLSDGERVLVCDVGGGTTDFTLIRVRVHEGVVGFDRDGRR